MGEKDGSLFLEVKFEEVEADVSQTGRNFLLLGYG